MVKQLCLWVGNSKFSSPLVEKKKCFTLTYVQFTTKKGANRKKKGHLTST
jgi:hypothetical protein